MRRVVLRVGLAIGVALGGGGAPAVGQFGAPAGGEFQVNTYTTAAQGEPDVAMGGDASFIVTWAGRGGGDDRGVFGQRFLWTGAPLGGEFQINSYTTGTQDYPRVAVGGGGGFVVVWKSNGSWGSDDESQSVQARRYASDGSALGDQFQVNTYTTGTQNESTVGVRADGSFVVAWQTNYSSGPDTDGRSIQAQRYDSVGVALGVEFQVNTFSSSFQSRPDIAMASNGSFVITWDSNGSAGTDTSDSSIQAQRLDSLGSAVGGEFQVNAYTTGHQSRPVVAMAPDDSFLIVWTNSGNSPGDDSDGLSIQARLFDSTGGPIGSDMQVNSTIAGDQEDASIASDAAGNFVVTWESDYSMGSDQDNHSVLAQAFGSDGSAQGGEFQVNTFTTASQDDPVVAMGPEGALVVIWEGDLSSGTDSDGLSVQGQRFKDFVFLDGFESGDTAAWK